MSPVTVLHETGRRLRLALPPRIDAPTLEARLGSVPGVESVRVNERLRCVVVAHDGRERMRARLIREVDRLGKEPRGTPAGAARTRRRPTVAGGGVVTAALAAAVPVLPKPWQAPTALAAVASRVGLDPQRLRSDPAAVLLDAASLSTLALTGQAPVTATSVLLRQAAELLAARLIRQADSLLSHVLPVEAAQYRALRGPADTGGWRWWPLRRLRSGDRVRLYPGDVAPLDGLVIDGHGELAGAVPEDPSRPCGVGDPVLAGERLLHGTIEFVAEHDAAGSRLERLRAQLRHAVDSRDPVGRLAPDPARALALPFTGAALVLAMTRDGARAAAMLQADPKQGMDLALPVTREAALFAMARAGLMAAGLEAIERLAVARSLVLQDIGVLAGGRWVIGSVEALAATTDAQVRRWLARLAGLPGTIGGAFSLPDRVVRDWARHGTCVPDGEHEVHVASPGRLQRLWGLSVPRGEAHTPAGAPRRTFGLVRQGRLVARVTLTSPLRRGTADRLRELLAAGFERVAIVADDTHGPDAAEALASIPRALRPLQAEGLRWLGGDVFEQSEWVADAVRDGEPLVAVHATLRELVPAGSLGLSPMAAEGGGPHGLLTGDPLASLLAARRLAQRVHGRLRLWQDGAVAVNAALMTAAATRLLPPMATTLLHHGFALLMLLDSLLVERLNPLRAPAAGPAADDARAAVGPQAAPVTEDAAPVP